MAAIEKIYGTAEEQDELRGWLEDEHPEFIRFLYPRPEAKGPISNFSLEADGVLYLTCPLPWVRERISEQYNLLGESRPPIKE